jgi:hypothetical protein
MNGSNGSQAHGDVVLWLKGAGKGTARGRGLTMGAGSRKWVAARAANCAAAL